MKLRDLTGARFGRLIAVRAVRGGPRVLWECFCDRGRTTTINSSSLCRGLTWTKLSATTVREIRRLRKLRVGCKAIAKRFGISAGTVADIARRRTWKDVA